MNPETPFMSCNAGAYLRFVSYKAYSEQQVCAECSSRMSACVDVMRMAQRKAMRISSVCPSCLRGHIHCGSATAGNHPRGGTSPYSNNSAICTALVAAPLRIWSPAHHSASARSSVRSSRMRPT